MQVSTAQVAEALGVSRRAASYTMREVGVAEELGNALFIDHLALRMAERARSAGRRWSAETALAAFDILDGGTAADLRADARSRLRAQLRTMDAATIASRARGVFGRVRRVTAPRGVERLEAAAAAAAMSALGDGGLRELGLHGGEGATRCLRMTGGEGADLTRAGVVDDSNGEIVLLVGATGAASTTRALVECFLLGDTRVARAAEDAIAERTGAL